MTQNAGPDPHTPATSPPDPAGLQFERAEPATPPSPASRAGFQPAPAVSTCAACGRPITDYYFEVGGRLVCPQCQQIILASDASGSGAARFFKAAVAGLGAAVAATAAWYGVSLLFHRQIFGIGGIVVAFLISGGIKLASDKRGGVAYQLLAVMLTYFAIGGTLIAVELTRPDSALRETFSLRLAIVIAVGVAVAPVMVALAAPVTGIILGFSLWEAWRLNRRRKITFNGPYRLADAGAPIPPPMHTAITPPPAPAWPPPAGGE